MTRNRRSILFASFPIMRNFIVHSQDSTMAKGKIYTSWNPKKINLDFFYEKESRKQACVR